MRTAFGLPAMLVSMMLATVLPVAADAASPATIRWGVSDSGLEFGRGNKAGTNYVVPDPAYYLARGLTLIRLPIRIERLAPDGNGSLDPGMLAAIDRIVDADAAAGAVTVLDLHGFGFLDEHGHPANLLDDPDAQADYLALIAKLAATFRNGNVALGLMNEPHSGSDAAYASLWNRAIAAARQQGFHGTIVVPHAHWSAASDISPQTPFAATIDDPDRNWVLELHLYLDPDDTGTYRRPVADPAVGVERIDGALRWARTTGVKLFLGETGAPSDPGAVAALSALLDRLAAAPDAVWGVALWGAGPWWKPNYPMRLDPLDGVTRPQLAALEDVAHPQQLYLATDAGSGTVRVRLGIDGHPPEPPVALSVDRFHGVQPVPVDATLAGGRHVIRVAPVAPFRGAVFVTGASWKGTSDSDDAFRNVGPGGSEVHVSVPPSNGTGEG